MWFMNLDIRRRFGLPTDRVFRYFFSLASHAPCLIHYQQRFYPDFSEPKVKALRRRRCSRGCRRGRSPERYLCSGLWVLCSREPNGCNSNAYKIGVLSGNHIRRQTKRKAGLSRFQRITYGLRAKGCYTDTQRGPACYLETIYTLLCCSQQCRSTNR
jgi:hypothetical protein